MTNTRVRFRRTMTDRIFGGVCGGMGEVLGISGWWMRGAWMALALTSFGFAVLLYLLLWASVPAQRIADLPPLVRPGEARPARYARPEGVLTIGGLAILVGVIVLALTTGVLGAGADLLLPLMAVLLGLIVLVKHARGIA